MSTMNLTELKRLLRRTPRTAKSTAQLDELRGAEDTILVNESDLHLLTAAA